MTHFQKKILFAISSIFYAKTVLAKASVVTEAGKHFSKNGVLMDEVFISGNKAPKTSVKIGVRWPEDQAVWNLKSPQLNIDTKVSIAAYKDIRISQYDSRTYIAVAFTSEEGERFVLPFEYNNFFSQDEESIEFNWGLKGERYKGKLARKRGNIGEPFVGDLVHVDSGKTFDSQLALIERRTVFAISPVQVIGNLPTISVDGNLLQMRTDLTTLSTRVTDLDSKLFFVSTTYYNYVDMHLNIQGGSFFYSKWLEWGLGAPCYFLQGNTLSAGCTMRGEVNKPSDVIGVNLSNPVGMNYNYHDHELNIWQGTITFIDLPEYNKDMLYQGE